ncbi:MAG: hemerythrin family protein [Cyanobacteria bacterium P01_E01_bin.42]
MTLLWSNSLKIGIPEIDKQHQQLIEQMGRLYTAIQKDRGNNEIQEILRFLNQYVVEHFGYEESCMLKYKCPIALKNKTKHNEFKANLKAIEEEFRTKGASENLAIEINRNLLEWFANHIKSIDTSLKSCMP